MPSYFPIALNLEGLLCVVVGGGQIAAHRIFLLLECGAEVRVVAPNIREDILVSNLEARCKDFEPGDLDGAYLAIAATDNSQTNSVVVAECRKRGILCCNTETAEAGDFIIPSTARRGDLRISITTGGASPALAKRIRDQIEEQFGPEYEIFVSLLRELRQDVLHNIEDASRRRDLLKQAAEDEIALQLIRERRIQEARDRLFHCISS